MIAPQPTGPDLLRWQRRIFGVAWLTYASFYLCRVNLAVALPVIQQDLGWSAQTAGAVGSTFLWVYAVGQLVNGTLGQTANARWFVGVGMLLSVACNLAFGASSQTWIMVLVWGINGWAQSMGWGAIIKTIAAWFGASRRGRIAALFSPSFVLGHLIAWSVGGRLAESLGWRYAFWIPAAAFGIVTVLWLTLIRTDPASAGLAPMHKSPARRQRELRAIVQGLRSYPHLRWAAVACAFASMVKDGLNLWVPTYLVEALDMPLSTAAWAASALPFFGLFGSMLAGYVSDRLFHSREAPGIVALSALIVAGLAGISMLAGHGSPLPVILLLGLCGMAAYGINSLLLTSLPLSFGAQRNVSAVAGFLDFSSYVGGGISALVVGQLLGWAGWTSAFVYWSLASALAMASALGLDRVLVRHPLSSAPPCDPADG